MTTEDRKAMIRRVNDELYNQGNLDVCDQIYAPNCSFHDPSFPVEGVAGLKQQVGELRAAYPDLHVDVQDVLIDGDQCATRWVMGGTSRGEYRGLPATGKSFVMTGITIDKFAGDRVVEEWINYDLLGTLQQMGVLPEGALPQQTGR
jgi:steroid delta-isomerase-like uncharacterized protein